MIQKKHISLLLLLCLAAQLLLPSCARAADAEPPAAEAVAVFAPAGGRMSISDAGVSLIKRYESFSPTMYANGGYWYVGYGSQAAAGAYPNGVTEAEADALLRAELAVHEDKINAFLAQNGLTLAQAQFDALVSFTYTLGAGWLSDTTLPGIIRGEIEATRLETARAFGVYSHVGGVVLPGLAERRLEEATLYLDGYGAETPFSYLAFQKEDGVLYRDDFSDFAVYERGGTYESFPPMIRLGYTLDGFLTGDGRLLRPGDPVGDGGPVEAVWRRNDYAVRSFPDVTGEQWFYDYVMELSEAGVVNGRGDGTFAPSLSVTTGEALKLVLLAAGVEEQDATDAHWASGYAQYARERGWLRDALPDDLDGTITRKSVARLAAGALGFGQSFSVSPFADVDDGFVTALYEIGVLTGTTERQALVYHPDDPISRAEISTIVWRLRNTVAFETRQTVVYGSRSLPVMAGVPFNGYDLSRFSGSGKTMTYRDEGVTVKRGIDVSRFQGDIDWNAVKADGIEFAILRVGGRYQGSGGIYDDRRFEEYYDGAHAAGLQIGVYFYAQSISVDEALEEADYVLNKLRGKTIDGPVVFDWESAGASGARTNGIAASLITDCAIAYCERVRAAGYEPMVYLMRYDGYMRYDLSRLQDYGLWYAGEYNGDAPRFFYDFDMWQYTSDGSVNGIDGDVDMDLWFFR